MSKSLLSAPLRYRLWKPRHLRLIWADLRPCYLADVAEDSEHLAAAIDWLCRAQDKREGKVDAGGVSAGWSFEDGWLPGYPETTGYIIETFLAAAEILDRPELVQRAQRMIDWELSLQDEEGAFPGHFGEPGSHPVIFNQGQIMHGMLAGYLQLGREECLTAAVRAGHWLVRHQEPEGYWLRYEHNGIPHVYNTRAIWALVATAEVAGEPELREAAIRHLDWALVRQTDSGWFDENAFERKRSPFTHTIAYAIRGFLESGAILGETRYLEAAMHAARGLAQVQGEDGWLAGAYADGWRADAGYCCLTGVAQMAINWQRCAQVLGENWLRGHAVRGIRYLQQRQRLSDPDPAVHGGIAGSFPIWGAYSRFEFPNWAAKFFADALMIWMVDRPIPPALASGGEG